MSRRPTLDQLFSRALAAVAQAKASPSATTAERLMRADDDFLARCNIKKGYGVTRGRGPRRPGFAEIIKSDPRDYAAYLEEEVFLPEVLARCKEQEKINARISSRERALSRSIGDAIELDDTSYKGAAHLRRKAHGKNVVLYHGTTSKFVPRIIREGLRVGQNLVEHQPTTAVFLTARVHGTPSAHSYAERAAHKFGGQPAILTVVVPFDDLAFDSDDEDIASGSFQFETDSVSPRQIVAVNDKPRKL